MPVLTSAPPTLATSVAAPPPGEAATPIGEPAAPVAGGQSRGGNPSSSKQNAWTRLFQSLLDQNKVSQDPGSSPRAGSSLPGAAAKGPGVKRRDSDAPPALGLPVVPVLQPLALAQAPA